jgi:hypothetical protein
VALAALHDRPAAARWLLRPSLDAAALGLLAEPPGPDEAEGEGEGEDDDWPALLAGNPAGCPGIRRTPRAATAAEVAGLPPPSEWGAATPQQRGELAAPLLRAAWRGQEGLARLLLRAGWPADWADAKGKAALHLAASFGHAGVAEALLSIGGASVDLRDRQGATPLLLAATGGHEGAVRVLLRHGADPSLPDRYGRTAQSVAGPAVAALLSPPPSPAREETEGQSAALQQQQAELPL